MKLVNTTTTAMNMQTQSSTQLSYSTPSDTTQAQTNSQYPSHPSASTRMTDTTQARRSNVKNDTTLARTNSQSPNAQARRNQSDTTKRNPNARVTGDTMSQRLPSNQYGNAQPKTPNSDSTQKNTDGSMSAQGFDSRNRLLQRFSGLHRAAECVIRRAFHRAREP